MTIILSTFRSYLAALLSGLLLSALFACSSPPITRIFWPRLPEKPMLEFVGIYATNFDFDKSTFDKVYFELFEEKSTLFKLPYGIATNNQGDIYLTDVEGLKVIKRTGYTANKLVPPNIVKQPLGLAIDSTGLIYLISGKTKCVFVLNENGDILQQIGNEKIFDKPSYVAVNEHLKKIYVSDKYKNTIYVFDMAGNLLSKIGKPGNGAGEFAFPQGIAISSNNDLYVADMLNSRIQVFNSEGKYLRSFGQQGANYWDFDAPRDLAFGPDGYLYIVDFRKALLYVFTTDGRQLLVLGDHKKRTNHPLGFSSPSSIHIDKFGRIYIADTLNNRYSVWQVLTDGYLLNNPIK